MYTTHILPHITDMVMDNPAMNELRPRVVGSLAGRVLELGFGSGRNLPHYGREVSHVFFVDPDTVGRRKAASRIAAATAEVVPLGLDGARVDLPDGSVDHVVCTWSLCTIPDVRAALGEVHRVLVDGGTFHFVEHGRHPREDVARWQDRVTPVWKRVAGGCRLNRQPLVLVEEAGLEVIEQETFLLRGTPALLGWTTLAVARRSATAT